jgi:glutathione S-transferase
MHFQCTAWATLATLLLCLWTMYRVGKARGQYGVKAPAVDGPPEFSRVLRVQVNTVEQMLLFLPALWLCALFLGDYWAAAGGAIWIVGRILYALGYYSEAKKRSAGFGIALFALTALMLGTAAGLLGLPALLH